MVVKADRLFTVLWLAILLVSGSMQNVNSTVATAAGVKCEIRTVRDDRGGKVEAIIRATGAVAGTYVFDIRKRSSGETTSQSGDFEIDSISPTEIKKASIELEPGQAYDASLKVKWPNGASSCSASVR
jgi:hypothetical protein